MLNSQKIEQDEYIIKDTVINTSIKTKSYEKAISTLYQIKKFKVPFEKMLLISTISNEITTSVNEFWSPCYEYIPRHLLNINADELMNIFIYILIKSQYADLLVHCKIIKEFTTTTTKSSMVGYYFITLEASLIFISGVSNKSDLLAEDVKKRCTPHASFGDEYMDEDYDYLVTDDQMS